MQWQCISEGAKILKPLLIIFILSEIQKNVWIIYNFLSKHFKHMNYSLLKRGWFWLSLLLQEFWFIGIICGGMCDFNVYKEIRETKPVTFYCGKLIFFIEFRYYSYLIYMLYIYPTLFLWALYRINISI